MRLSSLALSQQTQTVQAGTLYQNWNYSIDSANDGTEGSTIGSKSKFEFYGMAFKEAANKVYFAFNSNLSKDGYGSGSARNGRINYGDLFLNFKNTSSFNKANGSLYGIRFDGKNDTEVGVGLYQNVVAKSLTTVNSGYGSLQQHTNTVSNLKGSASYGDLAATTTYFNSSQGAYTTIASGKSLGSYAELSAKDLQDQGLDFSHFNAKGTYTFGFSIDRKLLPTGDFIANFFAECGNDGVALAGTLKDVPEPSALVGLTAVGLMVAGSRLRRRNSSVA
ncbi:MAG: PEP-CTERM sorting domain-containing protein [Leptolyngbyaceae cyanobacterium CRU_2_3]|nr:PEP-CTERM sorting domain-containing protein [Leptolyngbyaceae cyanobacterium CRU_2_3]